MVRGGKLCLVCNATPRQPNLYLLTCVSVMRSHFLTNQLHKIVLCQAYFCDKFDHLAGRWEQKQQELREPLVNDCRRCPACLELKPTWMAKFMCVVDRPGEEPPGWLKMENGVLNRPDILLARYHGKWLCSRCYSPLSQVYGHGAICSSSLAHAVH